MIKPTLLAGFLMLAHLASAHAQWQVSADAGMRYFRMTERGGDGRTLVTEQGWLPGARLAAERDFGVWRAVVRGEHFQGGLDYDGQLQSGIPFTSTADAQQSRIGVEFARAVSERIELIGGAEYDLWRRRVHGQGTIAGVTERYSSWRLLAGFSARLSLLADAASQLKFMLVAAQPERLEVQFDNRLFDDASFSTKPAYGSRISLSTLCGRDSRWMLTADLDWMKVRRSDDAPLLRNGFSAGTVTQPEHARTALTLALSYRF